MGRWRVRLRRDRPHISGDARSDTPRRWPRSFLWPWGSCRAVAMARRTAGSYPTALVKECRAPIAGSESCHHEANVA